MNLFYLITIADHFLVQVLRKHLLAFTFYYLCKAVLLIILLVKFVSNIFPKDLIMTLSSFKLTALFIR